MNAKEAPQAEAFVQDELQSDTKESSLKGTHTDERDMQILGKTQQLNVSILAPIMTLAAENTDSCSGILGSSPFSDFHVLQ